LDVTRVIEVPVIAIPQKQWAQPSRWVGSASHSAI
jgi:hypothetical protein